jgi:DNA end-binding protein Ku
MAATVWRGRLAFGMVSIPIRLHKAARRERVRFQHVYRKEDVPAPSEETEPDEPSLPQAWQPARSEPPRFERETASDEPESVVRVHNLPVAEKTETPLEAPRILKGYEIEKDRFVTFEPQEVRALRPETSTELSIAEFVRLDEIDPIYFDSSYYAAPDKGGEKAYALLFRTLAETKYAAVGSLAMHGREHATVIRPGRHGLILHTLYYQNEVRADEEYRGDTSAVTAKELDLAKRFVAALAAPFDAAKLKDTFEERLRALIESRTDRAVAAYEEGEVARRAPVIDIIEALRKSLEMAKKPPAKARPGKAAGGKAKRA